jgi:hypothetical protein
MRLVLAALAVTAVALTVAATVLAAAPDAFTGAWTGIDPDDGSTLRTQISAPSESGTRHVTLVDRFASACNATATATGFGAVSGAVLTATVDVRCGGAVLARDVTVTWEAVGDELLGGGGVVYTRPGG